MTMPRCTGERPGTALAIALAAFLGHAGPLAAATALEARPADAVPNKVLARFTALADEIGWGLLFRTEQMAAADTTYAAGAVLAVTATPYLPVHFWLESRA